jgi:hypothetical protein
MMPVEGRREATHTFRCMNATTHIVANVDGLTFIWAASLFGRHVFALKSPMIPCGNELAKSAVIGYRTTG